MKEKGTKLGQLINELSMRPKPYDLKMGDQIFKVFIHPATVEDLEEVRKALGMNNNQINDDVLRVIVAMKFKDAEGNPVWEKPEDIKVPPIMWAGLRLAALKYIFGIDLVEKPVEAPNAG